VDFEDDDDDEAKARIAKELERRPIRIAAAAASAAVGVVVPLLHDVLRGKAILRIASSLDVATSNLQWRSLVSTLYLDYDDDDYDDVIVVIVMVI
jgi:hypothetical protein